MRLLSVPFIPTIKVLHYVGVEPSTCWRVESTATLVTP